MNLAERCYHEAQADGFWVVDKSLADDSGSATLRNTRFPGIIALHEKLNGKIASRVRVGGPYWGLNIVLWAKGKLATTHPAHAEFVDLREKLTVLSQSIRAREQVAAFYKQWYDKIAAAPKAGRPMALFQDLSGAYALGKSLPAIEGEGSARRPEAVAESFMMSCL